MSANLILCHILAADMEVNVKEWLNAFMDESGLTHTGDFYFLITRANVIKNVTRNVTVLFFIFSKKVTTGRKYANMFACIFLQFITVGFGYGLSVLYVEVIRVFDSPRSEAALIQSLYFGTMTGGGKLVMHSFNHFYCVRFRVFICTTTTTTEATTTTTIIKQPLQIPSTIMLSTKTLIVIIIKFVVNDDHYEDNGDNSDDDNDCDDDEDNDDDCGVDCYDDDDGGDGGKTQK